MNDLQRTDEWYQARLGKFTASRYSDAMAKTRNGWGASRAQYMAELVKERLTGRPHQGFVSKAMQDGIEREPEALASYSLVRDVDIVPVGFVPHPHIEMAGASPDGLIGDDGLIEVKCPTGAVHINWLLGRSPIPMVHIEQIQWQLICTGRQWCDWVSFDPEMPFELQLYVVRVTRVSDQIVETMEHEVEVFLDEVALACEELQIAMRQKEAA